MFLGSGRLQLQAEDTRDWTLEISCLQTSRFFLCLACGFNPSCCSVFNAIPSQKSVSQLNPQKLILTHLTCPGDIVVKGVTYEKSGSEHKVYKVSVQSLMFFQWTDQKIAEKTLIISVGMSSWPRKNKPTVL